MTAPSRPPPNLAPLLHLLTGVVLGAGLVGIARLSEWDPAADTNKRFKQAADWGVLGAVGGLLGGVAAAMRSDGSARVPGMRFWMLALSAGGAVTLGAIALRGASSVPVSEHGGPALHVLTWLIVGWLAGVLLGAVGAAFAQAASPVMAAALRRANAGRPGTLAKLIAALIGGAVWGAFWGVLVALLVLLAVGIVLLSVRAGGEGPALAVGGTCGCVFFGLRYALSTWG